MRTWLAAAAVVPFVASHAARAQDNHIKPPAPEKSHLESNFSISETSQFTARSPIQDGMIAQEDLAPNAHVGLGLAPMLGRNIHSVRIEQEPVPTRNPGVTFVLKFPR